MERNLAYKKICAILHQKISQQIIKREIYYVLDKYAQDEVEKAIKEYKETGEYTKRILYKPSWLN